MYLLIGSCGIQRQTGTVVPPECRFAFGTQKSCSLGILTMKLPLDDPGSITPYQQHGVVATVVLLFLLVVFSPFSFS